MASEPPSEDGITTREPHSSIGTLAVGSEFNYGDQSGIPSLGPGGYGGISIGADISLHNPNNLSLDAKEVIHDRSEAPSSTRDGRMLPTFGSSESLGVTIEDSFEPSMRTPAFRGPMGAPSMGSVGSYQIEDTPSSMIEANQMDSMQFVGQEYEGSEGTATYDDAAAQSDAEDSFDEDDEEEHKTGRVGTGHKMMDTPAVLKGKSMVSMPDVEEIHHRHESSLGSAPRPPSIAIDSFNDAAEIKRLNLEREGLISDLAAQELKLKATEEELSRLKETLSEMEAQHSQREVDENDAWDQVKTLNEENEELRDQIAQLSDQLNSMDDALKDANDDSAHYRTKAFEYEKEIQSLRTLLINNVPMDGSGESIEKEMRRHFRAESGMQTTELTDKYQLKLQRVRELENQVTELEKTIGEMEGNHEVEKSELEEQILSEKERADNFAKDYEALHVIIDDLNDKVDSSDAQFMDASMIINEMQDMIDDLTAGKSVSGPTVTSMRNRSILIAQQSEDVFKGRQSSLTQSDGFGDLATSLAHDAQQSYEFNLASQSIDDEFDPGTPLAAGAAGFEVDSSSLPAPVSPVKKRPSSVRERGDELVKYKEIDPRRPPAWVDRLLDLDVDLSAKYRLGYQSKSRRKGTDETIVPAKHTDALQDFFFLLCVCIKLKLSNKYALSPEIAPSSRHLWIQAHMCNVSMHDFYGFIMCEMEPLFEATLRKVSVGDYRLHRVVITESDKVARVREERKVRLREEKRRRKERERKAGTVEGLVSSVVDYTADWFLAKADRSVVDPTPTTVLSGAGAMLDARGMGKSMSALAEGHIRAAAHAARDRRVGSHVRIISRGEREKLMYERKQKKKEERRRQKKMEKKRRKSRQRGGEDEGSGRRGARDSLTEIAARPSI